MGTNSSADARFASHCAMRLRVCTHIGQAFRPPAKQRVRGCKCRLVCCHVTAVRVRRTSFPPQCLCSRACEEVTRDEGRRSERACAPARASVHNLREAVAFVRLGGGSAARAQHSAGCAQRRAAVTVAHAKKNDTACTAARCTAARQWLQWLSSQTRCAVHLGREEASEWEHRFHARTRPHAVLSLQWACAGVQQNGVKGFREPAQLSSHGSRYAPHRPCLFCLPLHAFARAVAHQLRTLCRPCHHHTMARTAVRHGTPWLHNAPIHPPRTECAHATRVPPYFISSCTPAHPPLQPAYHSSFNGVAAPEVCGLAMLPLRGKARGPAPLIGMCDASCIRVAHCEPH